MLKLIRLFLLFVLPFFLISNVIADSDDDSDDPNYFFAEDLFVIGEGKTDADYRLAYPNYFRAEDLFVIRKDKTDADYRLAYPNYFRAEDLFVLGKDKTDADYRLAYPNYFRAEDLFAIGHNKTDAENPVLVQAMDSPPNKNGLPQLDDELAGDAVLLPMTESEPTSPTADVLRQSAEEFFAETDFELAIEQYQALLAFEPNNPTAHFNIGYAYYALENPAQAVVYLQQALDLQPDHLYAQYLLAMSYSMLDMPDEARDLMSAIYGKGQYDESYPLALGHVFRNLGYMEAAGIEFYAWLKQHERIRLEVPAPLDENPLALVMDNGVVYKLPFLAIAGESIEISVESYFLNPSPIDPLIVVLNPNGTAIAGDDDSGENFNASLSFTAPNTGMYTLLISHAGGRSAGDLSLSMTVTSLTADSYRSLAQDAIEQGRYQEAIDLIRRAIDLDGGQYNDYMMRAYAYRQVDDPTSAIAEYYLALSLSPYPEEVYANIGQTYQIKGDLDKANMAYSNALKIDPLLHAVRCDLGMNYAAQGDYQNAIQQFDYILTYNMTDSCAWSNRDATLQIMRELVDATVTVTSAQDYVSEGEAYAKQENWELAASAYASALKIDPLLSDVRCQLGMIYVTVEDYPDALEQFDILLAQNVTDLCAFENRRATLRLMNEDSSTGDTSQYIEAQQAYSDIFLVRDVYAYPLVNPDIDDQSSTAVQTYNRYRYDYPVASEWAAISAEHELEALYNMSMMLGSDALMSEAQARHEAGDVWMASALLDRYIDTYYATSCSYVLSALADEYQEHGYTVMANMLTLKAIGDSTC